jgi:hypothetical protein
MKMQSALKIAYNALQGSHVGLSWIMHVKTNLLNRVGNIWVSEYQVLQSTDQAMVMRRVADRIAHVTREL